MNDDYEKVLGVNWSKGVIFRACTGWNIGVMLLMLIEIHHLSI